MKNKYFQIDCVNGKTTEVTKTTEPVRRFNLELTGKYGYNERVKRAKGVINYYMFIIV